MEGSQVRFAELCLTGAHYVVSYTYVVTLWYVCRLSGLMSATFVSVPHRPLHVMYAVPEFVTSRVPQGLLHMLPITCWNVLAIVSQFMSGDVTNHVWWCEMYRVRFECYCSVHAHAMCMNVYLWWHCLFYSVIQPHFASFQEQAHLWIYRILGIWNVCEYSCFLNIIMYVRNICRLCACSQC